MVDRNRLCFLKLCYKLRNGPVKMRELLRRSEQARTFDTLFLFTETFQKMPTF